MVFVEASSTSQVSAVCRLAIVGLAYRAVLGVCRPPGDPPAALYAARRWRAVGSQRRRVRIGILVLSRILSSAKLLARA